MIKTLGLFVLSLVLLFAGNFIQFDDTSGFGSDEWLMPFALALAGLALMTKSVYRTSAPAASVTATERVEQVTSGLDVTGWARFVGYLTATVMLVFVAFFLGVAHFEYTECSGPDFGGECDLAVLGGFAWSAGAILLAVITIPIVEIILSRRRRPRTG